MILFYAVFNRARNKRTRTRRGWPLLFPASLPSVGLLAAFFFGGRCRGIPSTLGKRGGAFLCVFYISGGIVKNLHGHKISTAGAVLFPSWRCWFGLLRLSAHGWRLGQLATISPGVPRNSKKRLSACFCFVLLMLPPPLPAARGSGRAWPAGGGKW